jgi:hypothetical protein
MHDIELPYVYVLTPADDIPFLFFFFFYFLLSLLFLFLSDFLLMYCVVCRVYDPHRQNYLYIQIISHDRGETCRVTALLLVLLGPRGGDVNSKH